MNNTIEKTLHYEKVRKLLDTIYKEISEVDHDLSLIDGYCGMVLFYEQYFKVTKEQEHLDKLNHTIQMVHNNLALGNYPSYSYGLAGFGMLFCHLEKEKLISIDPHSFYDEIDIEIEEFVRNVKSDPDLDFLHGLVGLGIYLVERKKHNLIEIIICTLRENAIQGKKGIAWRSYIYGDNNDKEEIYELSLSHGNSAVIQFLLRCIKLKQEYSNEARILAEKAIEFIMDNQMQNSISVFPQHVPVSNSKTLKGSRLAWCNGDLGIALTLWYAGKILSRNDLTEFSTNLLLKLTKRKEEDSLVIDAGICHGSAGVAHIFHRMYLNTSKSEFLIARNNWLTKTLDFSNPNRNLSGYKAWGGEEKGWIREFGFLNGISGIGTVLAGTINQDIPNWDKILLMS